MSFSIWLLSVNPVVPLNSDMKVRKVWLIKKIFFPTKYHIQQIGITPVASQGNKQFQKKYFKENLSICEFFFFPFLVGGSLENLPRH